MPRAWRSNKATSSSRSNSPIAWVAAGWWSFQPDDPALYAAIPAGSGHREDCATYVSYAGPAPGTTRATPWDGPEGWEKDASRAWVAQLLWQALDTHWGAQRVV